MVNSIYVEDFVGKSMSEKIQTAIDYASSNAIKTVVLSDKDYYITNTIVLKKGIKLIGGYNSRVVIGANVRGFEIEQNSSLGDLGIFVDVKSFSKEVIYLDGKHKYYNTWNRTRLNNLTIVNWTGKVGGTAIHLYSGGVGSEISFVNFDDIKIVSFAKGIHLKADKPQSGFAYVNANRFTNISLEDCIDNLVLEGSETIPNECSGNMFTNLQIQPTPKTVNIGVIQGQYNKIEGMCWDLQEIKHKNPVFTFKADSNYNELEMKSIPLNRTVNQGKSKNIIGTF